MSENITSGVTRNPDASPLDEQCQIVDAVRPKKAEPATEYKMSFLDRYRNPEAIRRLVNKIIVGGAMVGLAAIVGAVGLNEEAKSRRYEAFMNRLQESPKVGYLIKSGDSLLRCGLNEGLNVEQSKYLSDLVQESNNLGQSGMIFAGDKIQIPDVNRDGYVSCSNQK